MEYLRLGLSGLIIGFSIAAPVGPIGVLVIRRTLADGRVYGLVSGLGAATADAFYGSVAGFGLTFISGFLIEQSFWLRLIGGCFLLALGVSIFVRRPASGSDEPGSPTPGRAGGLAGAYASTLFLTITNPLTILSFAGVMAGLGIGETGGDYLRAGMLVAGVFAGSAAWWVLLSSAVGLFRRQVTAGALRWVNRVSGLIIAAAGVVAVASLIAGSR